MQSIPVSIHKVGRLKEGKIYDDKTSEDICVWGRSLQSIVCMMTDWKEPLFAAVLVHLDTDILSTFDSVYVIVYPNPN